MLGRSGDRGAGGSRGRRQKTDVHRQQEALRAAGHAAYLDHDWDIPVLDLVFDSIVDTPHGLSAPVRRLRFVGQGCTVDVDVHGYSRLTVELRVSPSGPVWMESRTPGIRGPQTILWSQGQTIVWMRSQLTSFLLDWPESNRMPVRTAWVLL